MTLEELYALIGGNYSQAVRVMRKDKLIDRHIRKLGDSDLCDQLVAAGDAMDENQLYEVAHAMKGVCANLGIEDLSESASEICEQFRPGNERTMSDDEVKTQIAAIEGRFAAIKQGISQYAAE